MSAEWPPHLPGCPKRSTPSLSDACAGGKKLPGKRSHGGIGGRCSTSPANKFVGRHQEADDLTQDIFLQDRQVTRDVRSARGSRASRSLARANCNDDQGLIKLDGDPLAIMATLYREVTASRGLSWSLEDMIKEIHHLTEQMDDGKRRTYLAESLAGFKRSSQHVLIGVSVAVR